jgi:Glycosyltransferases, probably involved in cell wall biogenesis
MYSIIIPTLNEETLLADILKQLSEAELKNKYKYEIIISDGGSKDKTIDIAKRYADKICLNEDGRIQNIAIGRNIGAKAASGDILIFLNGDVTIDRPYEFFSFVENSFQKSNYLAMTCSVKIPAEQEILSDKLFHGFYNSYFNFLNVIGMGMGRGECQVIRRSIFEKLKGNNEVLAAGEDFDLFRKIRREGKVLFAKNLIIFESPRRYRKLGYFNVTFSWLKNSFSVVVKNKSISKEWEQIR